MDYIRYEEPRRFGTRGATGIYCRKCGREIALASQPRFRSVNKCAICVLTEEGKDKAADMVLHQYIQTDPGKPPIPVGAEGEDSPWNFFPEEEDKKMLNMPSGGVWGTVKSVYRALGFGKERPKSENIPESGKVAKRRRSGSLYT